MKKEKLNKNKMEETPKCLHEYCKKCHGVSCNEENTVKTEKSTNSAFNAKVWWNA